MNKKYIFISIAVAGLFWLLFWPTPVDPLPYLPPDAPEMSGVFAPNTFLRQAEHLGTGLFNGPEDVAVDQNGNIYGGVVGGKIIRLSPAGEVSDFADTGGRPLGMAFDAVGNLIVADAWKGLLSIDPVGSIHVLTTESNGIPFRFTDDLDIAADGSIYFSDASFVFHETEYLYDLIDARPNGRLLRYDPSTGKTETLLDGLYFANGVAISKENDFVLVNETYRYRITRYWIEGPKAGTSEIFTENLPGFPDNISATGDGRFWVAMFTVRNPVMDRLHPSPFLKKMMSRLPQFMWPKPARYGFVIEMDENGNVLRTLQDPDGRHLHTITSAKEIGGRLYLGSLYNDRIGVLDLLGIE